MMIRPSEAGHYRVLLTDGRWVDGYYISRKDMWVTPDGATALEVIVFESHDRNEHPFDELGLQTSHLIYDPTHSIGMIHDPHCDGPIRDQRDVCSCARR